VLGHCCLAVAYPGYHVGGINLTTELASLRLYIYPVVTLAVMSFRRKMHGNLQLGAMPLYSPGYAPVGWASGRPSRQPVKNE